MDTVRRLHIDIETYSPVDIKNSGLYAYVQPPEFEILLFAYSFDDEDVQIIDLAKGETLPDHIVKALSDSTVIKMAHNAAFEIACISKFYYTVPEQWQCSMVQAYYCHLPGSLGALCEALEFSKNKAKDRQGQSLIRYFCIPCKATARNGKRTRNLPDHDLEKWELFKDYCKQDVVAEKEVSRRLLPFQVPDSEWKLWHLDQEINRRGVLIDTDLVNGALQINTETIDDLTSKASELSGLDNPNSVAQLKGWLQDQTGYEVESLSKDVTSEMLSKELDPTVRSMLEIRRELGKTSVKKYQAIADAVCSDERVRGLLQFYGTGTGRWAGRLVQVQNLPRNYIDMLDIARAYVKLNHTEAIKLIYGSVQDTLSQLIRTAFIPSPGCRFIVSDFAAIEARVIAWLAKEEWRQEVFSTTGKIYEASASQMFGVPVETITPKGENYALRQKGKVAELALGYQGSTGALIQMGALDMGLTEDELPDIVSRWRQASPNIVSLWYAMENCAVAAVKTGQMQSSHGIIFRLEGSGNDFFLTVELPSGRKLYYNKPFLVPGNWDREQIHYYGVNQTTRKWAKTPTYGGKLTENIVQAIARDCLAESLLRLYKWGYNTVMHVHDEVVLDVPYGQGSLQEVCDVMGQSISWAPGLLLSAAGFETNYYKKD